jgi:hypothetical protein
MDSISREKKDLELSPQHFDFMPVLVIPPYSRLALYRASCNWLQPQKDRLQLVFQRPVATGLFEQPDRCGPVDSSPGLVFPNLAGVATDPGPVALPKMEKTGPDRTLNH